MNRQIRLKKNTPFLRKNLCSISGKINKSMKSLSILNSTSCFQVIWWGCLVYYLHDNVHTQAHSHHDLSQSLCLSAARLWSICLINSTRQRAFFLTQSFTNQTALYWRKNETNFVYLTLIIFYISYVFHPSKMFDGAHGNYLKYQHSNRRVTKI